MYNHDLISSLKGQIRDQLDFFISVSNDQLLQKIEDAVFQHSKSQFLTAADKMIIVQTIYNSFRGLDVIQPLIDDPAITEIMINNHKEIFIEQDGRISLSPIQFESQEKLEDIIQTIVSKVNRVVNESSPIVDARLQNGSRINVVLPPIALRGAAMTIRKFPDKPMTMEDLVHKGTLPQEIANELELIVKAKYNIFISGGTGSGKTTFLNALSNFIPADERIITIEDSAELQIINVPNLVRLETRNSNTEGRGEVSVRDLIKSSLRMRPNRIIVGEVRGAETIDMLQAMNTGHDGSLSTGHSNSAADMLSRLETMVLSGASLPLPVIRQQIGSAIDIMIHLSRMRDHSRKVLEISEITGVVNGEIQINPLYHYVYETECSNEIEGNQGRLIPTGNRILKKR